MRIQHNIMAMNAYRNYTNNVSAMQKNLEKLSSGYKINRAGDDAAGLAISEKMRAQITGLETAQKNAKDGISLVQTAEGALTEVHDMLNRMVELASQSANGTFDNEVDRTQMQKEIDQLRSEIDRIADSSNFNGIKLLDGKMGLNEAAFEIGSLTTAQPDTVVAGAATILTGANVAADATAAAADRSSKTVLHKSGKAAQAGTFTIDMSQLTANAKTAAGKFKLTIGTKAVATITATGVGKIKPEDLATKFQAKLTKGIKIKAADGKIDKPDNGNLAVGDLIYSVSATEGKLVFKTAKVAKSAGSYAAGRLESFTNNVPNEKVGSQALISPNFAIKITGTAAAKATVGNGVGNSQNIQATNIVGPSAGSITRLASTMLTLDMTKIQDGTKLVIGDRTYTFAIGENSQVDTSDATTIDLTAYKLEDVQKAAGTNGQTQLDIMSKITEELNGNTNFSFGHAGTAAATNYGKLSVAEKGDWTNVANPSKATAEIQKALETEDGFKGLFKVINEVAADANKPGIELNVVDGKVNDGDGVTIDGTRYVFTTDSTMRDTADAKYVTFTEGGNDAFTKLKSKLTAAGYSFGEVRVPQGDGTEQLKTVLYGKADPDNAGKLIKPSITGRGLTLQIGDTADPYNQLNVLLTDTHCSTLGIGKADLSIADQSSATKAIDTLKAAINQVSDLRGTLGATQNRLDHTINNLSVMQENIQDAEATIRDTDIAAEMMAYTKNNILIQSAQAMLAQANQVPQGVLQLLQ